MFRVERLTDANEGAALAYLDRAPYDHVFLAYLVLIDASPITRNAIYVAFDREEVRGVAFFGRQVVLGCEDDAIQSFAALARRYGKERMLVGPRETIVRYWEAGAAWHGAPRLVRDRQPLFALEPQDLRAGGRDVTVRRARIDEWEHVSDNSAQMIALELDYDPLKSSPDFASNVRQMIERGLWWIGESHGQVCFYCHIGPWSPRTAQLQGIWTPPKWRGRGLATGALSAICKQLLQLSPTISLYVNDFNAPALALYERVGFRRVGELQTLLF